MFGQPASRTDSGVTATAQPVTSSRISTPDLKVLPCFVLRHGNTGVTLPPAAQRLVTYVAVQDRPVPRGQLACALWDDATTMHGAANLRTTLWRTHHACRGLLDADATHIMLAEDVTVDVRDAIGLTMAITNSSCGVPEGAESAVAALSADLLPDWDEEWLTSPRERWRQLRLHALEILALRLADVGRHVLAVEAALAAITSDPLRETAHRCLIHVHLAEGNRAEAMRAYLRLVKLLNSELGVMPGPEVHAMIANLPIDRLSPTGRV